MVLRFPEKDRCLQQPQVLQGIERVCASCQHKRQCDHDPLSTIKSIALTP
jgi:hypothetical protein